MKRIITTVVLAVAATAAQADDSVIKSFISGNQLYSYCRQEGQSAQNSCVGYIIGAADALGGIAWCHPKVGALTIGQVRDVVKKWMVLHPEKRDMSADSMVAYALGEAWPCEQKQLRPSSGPLL